MSRPQRKLEWICRRYAPGVLDEEHTFRIIPAGENRFRLTYHGRFEGLLVPFVALTETKQGYERMFRALGEQALSG